MKLYRVIGLEELLKILKNDIVVGRFQRETEDNDYKTEYGPVVCCFARPVHPSAFDSFMIELNVDESQIAGSGTSRWRRTTSYGHTFTITEPEIYISHYRPSQVRGIYPLLAETVIEEFKKCHADFLIEWFRDSLDEMLEWYNLGLLDKKEQMQVDIYKLLLAGDNRLKNKNDIDARLL